MRASAVACIEELQKREQVPPEKKRYQKGVSPVVESWLWSFDRKLFYSIVRFVPGMKAETKSAEKNSQATKLDLREKLGNKLDIKDKLDLDGMVGDMGITMPSTNIGEYLRVLKLARKPSREEFTMVAKISMAGIGAIGALGFLIYGLLTELPKVF